MKEVKEIELKLHDKIKYVYTNLDYNRVYEQEIETKQDLKDYTRMIKNEDIISSITVLSIKRPKYVSIYSSKKLLSDKEKEILKPFLQLYDKVVSLQKNHAFMKKNSIIIKFYDKDDRLAYTEYFSDKDFLELPFDKKYTLEQLNIKR